MTHVLLESLTDPWVPTIIIHQSQLIRSLMYISMIMEGATTFTMTIGIRTLVMPTFAWCHNLRPL